MMRIPMSAAASALLRALRARAGVPSNRILLTDITSVEWQSLTLVGERHEIELRMLGPESDAIAERLSEDLADAQFDIPGQIVADIAVRGVPVRSSDGGTMLTIEALTIEE
jgi:hypothetical protein